MSCHNVNHKTAWHLHGCYICGATNARIASIKESEINIEREQWRRDFAGQLFRDAFNAIAAKNLSQEAMMQSRIRERVAMDVVMWTDLLLDALEKKPSTTPPPETL